MKVTIPKYNEEGSKVIGEEEKEVLGLVKYVGISDSLKFINGKIYPIIELEGSLARIVDEVEDYLYDINYPTLNESYEGKFELVKDFTGGKIKKIIDTI